jgi:hypothetical protein
MVTTYCLFAGWRETEAQIGAHTTGKFGIGWRTAIVDPEIAHWSESEDRYDFNLTFALRPKQIIGMRLDPDLKISGFSQGSAAHEIAEQGMLLVGDQLVALNSEDLSELSFKVAIGRLKSAAELLNTPMTLRVRPDVRKRRLPPAQEFNVSYSEDETSHGLLLSRDMIVLGFGSEAEVSEEELALQALERGSNSPDPAAGGGALRNLDGPTPIEASGLVMPGDRLVSVNGRRLSGLSYTQALAVVQSVFTKEVVRCRGSSVHRHCRVEAEAQAVGHKVLTFATAGSAGSALGDGIKGETRKLGSGDSGGAADRMDVQDVKLAVGRSSADATDDVAYGSESAADEVIVGASRRRQQQADQLLVGEDSSGSRSGSITNTFNAEGGVSSYVGGDMYQLKVGKLQVWLTSSSSSSSLEDQSARKKKRGKEMEAAAKAKAAAGAAAEAATTTAELQFEAPFHVAAFGAKCGCIPLEVVLADPIDACGMVDNELLVKGKVAVVRRGACFYAEKVRNLQEAQAVGVVVINTEGSPSIHMPSGHLPVHDLKIPALMIGYDDGRRLIELLGGQDVLQGAMKVQAQPTTGAVCSRYVKGGCCPVAA